MSVSNIVHAESPNDVRWSGWTSANVNLYNFFASLNYKWPLLITYKEYLSKNLKYNAYYQIEVFRHYKRKEYFAKPEVHDVWHGDKYNSLSNQFKYINVKRLEVLAWLFLMQFQFQVYWFYTFVAPTIVSHFSAYINCLMTNVDNKIIMQSW